MLKKIVFGLCIPLAILGAAALSFSGCGKSAPASDSAGKMKVVATTTMLTDLARQHDEFGCPGKDRLLGADHLDLNRVHDVWVLAGQVGRCD